MTLKVISQGHSPFAGLFKCNPSHICAVFCQISTDSALARSLSDSWASCCSQLGEKSIDELLEFMQTLDFVISFTTCQPGNRSEERVRATHPAAGLRVRGVARDLVWEGPRV